MQRKEMNMKRTGSLLWYNELDCLALQMYDNYLADSFQNFILPTTIDKIDAIIVYTDTFSLFKTKDISVVDKENDNKNNKNCTMQIDNNQSAFRFDKLVLCWSKLIYFVNNIA